MSKSKSGNDQKRKAERKAERKAAEAAVAATEETDTLDAVMVDAPTEEVKETEDKEKKEKDKKDKKDKKEKKEKKGKKEKKKKADEAETEDAAASKDKKEKKDKKRKASEAATEDTSDSPTKKRKTGSGDELEIDISLPQPPSKKALRKLKKHPELAPKILKPTPTQKAPIDKSAYPEHSSQVRSKWGIWIGNLAFSTTPETLRAHLAKNPDEEITRVNLPIDAKTGKNRGFAYVDFASEAALEHALAQSETLLGGRKVLIKNAKDFSKRPDKNSSAPAVKTGANMDKNPPSRILYCGNLDFTVTAEVLEEHFKFAGKIQRVRLATFEDSGKCKGFAFVDFEDKDGPRRAMLGLSKEEEETLDTVEGKEEVALAARRKKRAVLVGRPITMEYGQDPSVRYKKRFGGKEKEGAEEGAPREKKKEWKDNRSADAGAAYSSDARRTGAITAGEGKKISFD